VTSWGRPARWPTREQPMCTGYIAEAHLLRATLLASAGPE